MNSRIIIKIIGAMLIVYAIQYTLKYFGIPEHGYFIISLTAVIGLYFMIGWDK